MKRENEAVERYIEALPEDRRAAIAAVRHAILERLPEGYVESMSGDVIGYAVPLERYPNTYNKQPAQLAGLASRKRNMVLYLMTIYTGTPELEWFERRFAEAGKRLDMGKACVYFRKLDDLPLDVITEEIERWPVDRLVEMYESARRRP